MSRVIVTEKAIKGLEKCQSFLIAKNPIVAKRASRVIFKYFSLLEENPEMGRPFLDMPELRELVIEFGASGYVALYRYVPSEKCVYVLAFRHQKEAGYDLV